MKNLKGTEKQIAWAEEIRNNWIENIAKIAFSESVLGLEEKVNASSEESEKIELAKEKSSIEAQIDAIAILVFEDSDENGHRAYIKTKKDRMADIMSEVEAERKTPEYREAKKEAKKEAESFANDWLKSKFEALLETETDASWWIEHR